MAINGDGELGYTEEIYYDADGSIAVPTWVLIPGVVDVQQNSSKNKADIAERNVPIVGVEVTHTVYSVDVTITKRNGNTDYDALRAAYEAGTRIGIAVMSGPIATTGEKGFQSEAYITSWSDDGAHEGNTVSLTLEPAANPTTAASVVTIP